MWGIMLYLLSLLGLSPVPYFATLIGTTEPALKLLISILMGYPLAIIYHKYVKQHVEYRNIFFALAGIDMAFYNFRLSMIHNAIPALVIHFTTMLFGVGRMNVIITCIFNMAYLVAGYIATESEDYDITWTMPHCVLTLKLIALSFDLYDGQMNRTKENGVSLATPPTFQELFGFVYFPACFLVGPLFSFRRYKDFITDKYPLEYESKVYEKQALIRLLQGLAYLVAFQVGVSVYNVKYMLSDEFWETSIFYRHMYCGLWGHFALYKYISCWLLTEASCIRIGLSYNGSEKNVRSKWDGCCNIKLMRFETATNFRHYITSFNCNTNDFALKYIYKRLYFLGNKNISQLFTLLFLALWHGTRSGYYMTFLNEFLILYMESGIKSILTPTELYELVWNNKYSRWMLYVILKMYTLVFMGWSLVPFDVKAFSKWWSIYYSLYFSGFILFLPWALLYRPLLIKLVSFLKLKESSIKERYY